MKSFILKFFLLVITLFFGVLLGMQQANEGLLHMKGFDDKTFGGAFHIKKTEAGEVEAAVLGQEITAHDIEEKQQELEEMKAFHLISNIGSRIGELLSIMFQHLTNLVVNTLDKALS